MRIAVSADDANGLDSRQRAPRRVACSTALVVPFSIALRRELVEKSAGSTYATSLSAR